MFCMTHGRRSLIALLLLAAAGGVFAAQPGGTLGRTRSTAERMQPERAAAAERDAAAHQAQYEAVPPLPGLHDYRVCMHVHAEDSSHTGGTLPELLEDAKRAGVDAIFLGDHYRPPRDFMDGWRGLKDGVLFVPGSEWAGFLLHPDSSMMGVLDGEPGPLIEAAGAGTGMLFLSHPESRLGHSMDGLTGMEIYNRHYDAMDDMQVVWVILQQLMDPVRGPALRDLLEKHHDALLASQLDYPAIYLRKWDQEAAKQPVVGVAANDAHHNQVMIVRKLDDETVTVGMNVDKDEDRRAMSAKQFPGIATIVQGHAPGDEIIRLDLDPYYWSFRTVSNHVLATELSEPALRAALRSGHSFVSHDWMGDPRTARVVVNAAGAPADAAPLAIHGDTLAFRPGLELSAAAPIPCIFHLVRDGERIASGNGRSFTHPVDQPGVYRMEAWLMIDEEERPWIYFNPVYLRAAPEEAAAR